MGIVQLACNHKLKRKYFPTHFRTKCSFKLLQPSYEFAMSNCFQLLQYVRPSRTFFFFLIEIYTHKWSWKKYCFCLYVCVTLKEQLLPVCCLPSLQQVPFEEATGCEQLACRCWHSGEHGILSCKWEGAPSFMETGSTCQRREEAQLGLDVPNRNIPAQDTPPQCKTPPWLYTNPFWVATQAVNKSISILK